MGHVHADLAAVDAMLDLIGDLKADIARHRAALAHVWGHVPDLAAEYVAEEHADLAYACYVEAREARIIARLHETTLAPDN